MSRLQAAEDFTPCRWPDCLYYGKVDEGGHVCDKDQVAVCEEIRAREELDCKYITGDARCVKGSEPGYTDWCPAREVEVETE